VTRSRRIRVLVVGSSGRMGRFACELVDGHPELVLVGEVRREEDFVPALDEGQADVGVDLTRAGYGHAHGVLMLEAGVRPVIGTSGVTPADAADLDRIARERKLGGIVVPNFSVGMWLLQEAACHIARHLEKVEIVELHHDQKHDAPSSTSIDTALRLRAARGEPDLDVPIHSVRLPGLYAHQEVLFGSAGETLRLRHDMSSPEAFAPGLVRSIQYAATATGVASSLGAAFGGRLPVA
jgi:4-hydroxy-tetrahydrodipicolinate reductase